jgi:hypothetical protein
MLAISSRVRFMSGIWDADRKAVSAFEDFILCATEATRRIGIRLRLIGRDQMAGGAPALGDDLAFRRIASESAVR